MTAGRDAISLAHVWTMSVPASPEKRERETMEADREIVLKAMLRLDEKAKHEHTVKKHDLAAEMAYDVPGTSYNQRMRAVEEAAKKLGMRAEGGYVYLV